MSETLFAALWKTKTPEEFVENYLIPALQHKRLPGIRKVYDHFSGGKEPHMLNALMDSLPREGYSAIAFVNRANNRQICYFRIGRTAYNRPFPEGIKYERPHGKLFENARFKLSISDFENAANATGLDESFTPGEVPVTYQRLKIPRMLLEHHNWANRLSSPPKGIGPGTINVELSESSYKKLQALDDIETFFHRYF
jgi:hypothetical protein